MQLLYSLEVWQQIFHPVGLCPVSNVYNETSFFRLYQGYILRRNLTKITTPYKMDKFYFALPDPASSPSRSQVNPSRRSKNNLVARLSLIFVRICTGQGGLREHYHRTKKMQSILDAVLISTFGIGRGSS